MGSREAEFACDHEVGIQRTDFEPGGADVAAFSIPGWLGVDVGLGLSGGG